jgi:hypothetical protein
MGFQLLASATADEEQYLQGLPVLVAEKIRPQSAQYIS